ncbi:Thiol-disulfide isomerase or thioredoxin [Duganella sp. CF458]|uniref:redoxin family protein n=1 Tax=Duganella sp. CF458 TaxID=1884368 RepID=UPI0008E83513|nr:redoxin family protein [Duganella sp. CF458]SFF63288.1 Thiol-disulfide isomerase or thioredoxin [Duganella sp. CF458]
MFKPLIAALLMSLSTVPAHADEAGSGASRARLAGKALVGQPGPAAVLQTIDGQRIDLASFYGKKPVYLKFWATWCVPCREQMPAFEKSFQQYGDKLAVVAVNAGYSDTEAEVKNYRARSGLHMPIVIDDGALAASLNLRVTPQHIVIGRDGRIRHVGHLHDKELEKALYNAVNERAVAAPLALAPAAAAARAPLKVGDLAQGLPLPAAQGKPRALMFFSPWCESYLRESRPAIAQACQRVREEAQALAATPGIEWMAVASPVWSSDKEVAEFARSKKSRMAMRLDQDGALFNAFGIRQIPSIVLLDRQGRVARVMGPEERGLAQAVQALQVQ